MHQISEDVGLLRQAAKSASDIALTYFKKSTLKSWDKSKGHPVTEADMAVNAHLEQVLREARPDYGWLSEESPKDANLRRGSRNFIIDPIDGTSAFIGGRSDWCIALAMEENHKVIAAAVSVPVNGACFHAGRDMGAWRDNVKLFSSVENISKRKIISKKADFDNLEIENVVRYRDHPYSMVLRFVLLAEGSVDAVMATGYKSDWDIAAGAFIAQEAGAVVSNSAGNPLSFNHAQPVQYNVIAAIPSLHNSLIIKADSPNSVA